MSVEEKKIRQIMIVAALAIIPCVLYFYKGEINRQDTTVFALSYKYGFISRGLLGTIWQWVDKIVPFTVMNFWGILRLSQLVTVVYFLSLLGFYYVVLKKSPKNKINQVGYLLIFLSVFCYPMFLTLENFGRLDEYLMIITLLSLILLIEEKVEWLIFPLCILAMMLHQGYVFLEGNIVMALLFYKAMKNKSKRKKYLCIFIISAIAILVLLIYFELYGHANNAGVFDEVVTNAKSLSQDGNSYSESLVNHEILGKDVYGEEQWLRKMNYWEAPFVALFFWPYLVIGGYFISQLLKKGYGLDEKLGYIVVALGSTTVLPEVLLKVDLGRYIFSVFFYYIAIVLSLIAMRDLHVISIMDTITGRLKEKMPMAELIVVYPLIFMPLLDVHTSQMIWDICFAIWNALGIPIQ